MTKETNTTTDLFEDDAPTFELDLSTQDLWDTDTIDISQDGEFPEIEDEDSLEEETSEEQEEEENEDETSQETEEEQKEQEEEKPQQKHKPSRAKKRIEELARERKELAEALAQEKLAKDNLMKKLKELENVNNSTQKEQLLAAVEMGKASMKNALEEGDTDTYVEQSQKVQEAVARLAAIEANTKEETTSEETEASVDARNQLTEEDYVAIQTNLNDWISDNDNWFTRDPKETNPLKQEATRYAVQVSDALEKRGIFPNKRTFFLELDLAMDKFFDSKGVAPEDIGVVEYTQEENKSSEEYNETHTNKQYEESEQQEKTATNESAVKRTKPSVQGTASTRTPNKNSLKKASSRQKSVVLSQAQKEMASQLGISEAEYAKELAKLDY